MEKHITYRYGVGGLEEIKTQAESLSLMETLDEVEQKFQRAENSAIIIPRVVGVYQLFDVGDEKHEDKYSEEFREFVREVCNQTGNIAQHIIEERGISPWLIHVGYDTRSMSASILRKYFDNKRLVYSPWMEMPNFKEKDILSINEIVREFMEGGEKTGEKLESLTKKIVEHLEKLKDIYGLTSIEMGLLNTSNSTLSLNENSELITDPRILHFFQYFLR